MNSLENELEICIENGENTLCPNNYNKSVSHIIVHELLGKLNWHSSTRHGSQKDLSQISPPEGALITLKYLNQHIVPVVKDLLLDGVTIFDLNEDKIENIINVLVKQTIDKCNLNVGIKEMSDIVLERENEYPEAIGENYNILLGESDKLNKLYISFAKLSKPINFGAPDGLSTEFIFLILYNNSNNIVEIGETIALLMNSEIFHNNIFLSENKDDINKAFVEYNTTLLPEQISPVISTISNDFNDIIRNYKKEFIFNFKSLESIALTSSSIFISVVILGFFLDKLTHGEMNITDTIGSTAICGIIYSLIGGQSITIIGIIGPVTIFIGMLYDFSQKYDLSFRALYFWTGFWCMIFLFLAAFLNNISKKLKYITRFSDEIHTAIMSIIFVEKSVNYLFYPLFKNHDTRDIILLQIIIGLSTYYLTEFLHSFKYNKFLIPIFRKFLVYFSSIIVLIFMVIIETSIKNITTNKLNYQSKSFNINEISNIKFYMIIFSIIPGFFASILIFLDHNITLKLLDKTHKLDQTVPYSYDMLIIGLCTGLCSFLGLPWICAGIIRTVNYMSSLSIIEDEIKKNGDIYSHFIKINANRFPSLIIHIFIGTFFFYKSVLNFIPESVIYGFILYMGISSMTHNQIFDRIKLWFMVKTIFPPAHYVRNVNLKKIHYFTLIQIICIIILIIIKSYIESAFTFPFVIIIFIYLRFKIIPLYYNSEELEYLDSEKSISSNQIREAVVIG